MNQQQHIYGIRANSSLRTCKLYFCCPVTVINMCISLALLWDGMCSAILVLLDRSYTLTL